MGGSHQTVNRHSGIVNRTPCLSLWERWPSEARTERGNRGAIPSQSPSVTALPEGEPRGCTQLHTKNGAYRFRYAPFTVLRPPLRPLGDFSICQKVPTFIGRKQASFGRQKRRSFRCAAYRLLVNRAADYSLGPASTRALPASLPSYLTKFLTNRPARSLALVSHSSTLA